MELNQKSTTTFGALKTSAFSSLTFQNIRKNKKKIHAYLNRFIILTIFVSTIGYIASINDLSIKGFILRDLKKDIARLEVENEKNELLSMNLASFELINEKAIKLGMVKVDDIKYVRVSESVVSRR